MLCGGRNRVRRSAIANSDLFTRGRRASVAPAFILLAEKCARDEIPSPKQLPGAARVLYSFLMRRFGMTYLRKRALAAVDEAADQANDGPVRRSLALRFTLAFLANFADERWPFDNFWQAIGSSNDRHAGRMPMPRGTQFDARLVPSGMTAAGDE